MEPTSILSVLLEAAVAVKASIEGVPGRGLSGLRPTQYHLDIAADEAALAVLVASGLSVFSEESGLTGAGELVCVLDPIDGSTNCDRGIPFFSTSLAVLDREGPLVGVVVNQATGVAYSAIRGEGAFRDGIPIATSKQLTLDGALVATSGVPDRNLGWTQHRSLGAASLECCLVADGGLDAYIQMASSAISPWDYLAGLLIVNEAGGCCLEQDGLALDVVEAVQRRPVIAASETLAVSLVDALDANDARGQLAPSPTMDPPGA